LAGTIVSGTYFLTSIVIYLGADAGAADAGVTLTGNTYQETAAITTTTFDDVRSMNAGPPGTFTLDYTISGTTMNLTLVCPPPVLMLPIGYSATSTELDIFGSNGTKTEIYAYTKQ
jgi:hypothetical protein